MPPGYANHARTVIDMDIFNRLFMVAVALGAVAVSIVLILVAVEAVNPEDISPDGWLRDQLQEVDELSGDQQTATILSVFAVLIVAVLLLALEVFPLFTVEKTIAADAGGTEFRIYADSIKQLIVQAGIEIEGVTAVTPSFRKSAGGLKIGCQATLASTANMPEASSKLREKVKATVEGMSGVAVADVSVKVRYQPERPRKPGRVS